MKECFSEKKLIQKKLSRKFGMWVTRTDFHSGESQAKGEDLSWRERTKGEESRRERGISKVNSD